MARRAHSLQKLDKRLIDKIRLTDNCWEWVASKFPNGYGQSWDYDIQMCTTAHRVVYKALVGSIPEGMHLDHLCRNIICVNPSHLEIVTPRENLLRGTGASSRNAAKTHCTRGHLFSPETTRHNSRGDRVCKPCDVIRTRKYKKARGMLNGLAD